MTRRDTLFVATNYWLKQKSIVQPKESKEAKEVERGHRQGGILFSWILNKEHLHHPYSNGCVLNFIWTFSRVRLKKTNLV